MRIYTEMRKKIQFRIKYHLSKWGKYRKIVVSNINLRSNTDRTHSAIYYLTSNFSGYQIPEVLGHGQ